MPIPAPHRTATTPTLVVVLLSLLLGIQPITTDLYLPALPTIARDLHAGATATQQTLAALILGFGLGQLASGPLADRWGRRPVLIGGLAVYSAAGVFAAFAGGIDALVGWRSLQGLAMAAAVTGARSIIRDLYPPLEGARVMSRAMTGLGVMAFAAPVTGGFILTFTDWHVALLAPALFGLATLALVARRFEESAPRRNPDALNARALARNARAIVRDPTFRAFTLLASATYGGLFVMLAGSSFVFIDVLGSSRAAYGAWLASVSVAYIAGTLVCRRLLVQRGLRATIAIGGAVSLAGGVSMAALSLAGVWSAWAIAGPMWLYAIGHGIHQPCAQAGAVGPFPEKAGTAAALTGFAMMALAYAASIALGRSMNGTVYPLTFGVAAFSIVVAGTAWTLVQRHGDVRALPASSGQPA
ncbi:MAG TPA: multidrug effflux MFS transporter [Ideonella sp.]|nr:multidrug effflux MFS transporter [Ideonella sp.]